MILPKYLDDEAIVLENNSVGQGIYRMTLASPDVAKAACPGQFVNVGLDPRFHRLRRPFGVADIGDNSFTMYYRVIGEGTLALTELSVGDTVSVLGPLGNGFDMKAERPLLVGGGMGLAPLLLLARQFHGAADILLGGRNKEELFWTEYFRPYINEMFVTTDDGSVGRKGFTTELLPELLEAHPYDCLYVCGPEIMMKKIAALAVQEGVPCQVSLEKRMACGLGACLSCACDTTGAKRVKVCKDGPVFWARDVFKEACRGD